MVSGQVLNGTSSSLPAVRVAGTVYDREGRGGHGRDGPHWRRPFRPGEQRPFTLRFRNGRAGVVRYYGDITRPAQAGPLEGGQGHPFQDRGARRATSCTVSRHVLKCSRRR